MTNDSDTDSAPSESDDGRTSPQVEHTFDTVPPPRSPIPDVTELSPHHSPRTTQTDNPASKNVEMDQGQNIPQNKIIVTLVERKVIGYFSDNICIKQTDITETYPVFVPEEWDKAVPCNHGMKTK